MARARNIKPAFFNNDELAEIEPIGRLLFIGLWTICDYKGNLEYRPKKIKASILPYDNCSVDKLSISLEQSGFIQSYSNNGVTYINISNFTKHQNPHKNERDKGSDVPCIDEKESQLFDLKGSRIKSDNITINPDKDGSNPADSLILIPDPLSLIPDNQKPEKKQKSAAQALDYSLWESKPSDDVLTEWLLHRKKKNLSISQLVINKTGKEINEALKLGYSADDCLSETIVRGWQGVKAEWMQNSGAKKTALHDVADKEYYEGAL